MATIARLPSSPKSRFSPMATTMTTLGFEKYQAKEVQLSCFNENTAGLLLYPKLGFIPFSIEERPAPGGRRSALIHMTHHKT